MWAAARLCAALAGGGALLLPGSAAPGTGQEPDWVGVARWAHVVQPVTAREAPSATAPPVTVVRSATPEGETNLVRVLELSADARLPGLGARPARDPPRTDRRAGSRARRSERCTTCARGSWWIGSGSGRRSGAASQSSSARGSASDRARWPTPRGDFYVREKLARFDDPFYGPVAFGTSARSRVLADWPGGGYVGIHGTDRPDLIPGRISHGCIRLRNADALRLAQLMPLGTPVTIV